MSCTWVTTGSKSGPNRPDLKGEDLDYQGTDKHDTIDWIVHVMGTDTAINNLTSSDGVSEYSITHNDDNTVNWPDQLVQDLNDAHGVSKTESEWKDVYSMGCQSES